MYVMYVYHFHFPFLTIQNTSVHFSFFATFLDIAVSPRCLFTCPRLLIVIIIMMITLKITVIVTLTVTVKFYNYNHETNRDLETLSVSQFKKNKVKTSQAP